MAKDTTRLDAMVTNLTKRGVALPRNPNRARLEAHSMHRMAASGKEERHKDFQNQGEIERIHAENEAMRKVMGNNRALRRQASNMTGDTYAAIPRFYDPLEYWDLSGLPWNVADEGHRHKLHKWLRLYYATHYLIPILIDIFTRFPLVGMELKSKDSKHKAFYDELFINQLDYPEFLVTLGREFWCVGEAYPLGSFDENLGIWESEELINPEDVVIENFPLLGSRQLKIVPPDYLKKLAQTESPAKEYRQLEINFPEIIPYLRKNEHMPISSVLLKQVANTLTTWDDHGTPILLRGLRTLIHEEKLLASQDAIAERLYSPLILAQLGLEDLGDGQGPWIPGPEEIDNVRDELDVALSSDFRLMVHHMGLKMENVFGREQMPRLGDDFDRIEKRIMQIFGVNPSLLSAGSMSQPYASSALQAEFLNQILRTFQGYLKRHYRERAMVVAEAQEHYAYEKKGQTRVPIYEEVVEVDEETGEKRIVKKHKLFIPDLEFATLDLRDEATERQFLQSMRQMGVPIPDEKLMIGVDMPMGDMVDEYQDELVEKTIKQQEAKMKTYKALQAKNLPIPADLKAEVEQVLGGGEPQPSAGGLPNMPSGGGGPGGMAGPMGGPGEGIVMPPPPAGLLPPGQGLGPTGIGTGAPGTPGSTPPIAPNGQGIGGGFAPPASFERRPGMPRPASVRTSGGDWFCPAYGIPDDVKEQIQEWAQSLPWDEAAKLQDPSKYHITSFYSPAGFSNPDLHRWVESESGMSYPAYTHSLDTFSSPDKGNLSPIVMRFHAPELSAHAENMMNAAEERGLAPARFEGGHKPHITLGHNPYGFEVTPPHIEFMTEPLHELHSYYDALKRSSAFFGSVDEERTAFNTDTSVDSEGVENDTDTPQPETSRDEEIVHTLPRAAKVKSYSFIEEDEGKNAETSDIADSKSN